MKSARERVIFERKVRYGSARSAATAGGISNTLWSRYEKDGNVTDAVRAGVARAFKWGADWPENLPPPSETPSIDAITQLRAVVEPLAQVVLLLAAEASGRLGDADEIVARLGALEAALDRQQRL